MPRCQQANHHHEFILFLIMTAFTLIAFNMLLISSAQAAPVTPVASTVPPGWFAWLKDFRQEALADGIRPQVFDLALAGVLPSRSVVSYDRNQPEKRITYMQYRKTRIDPYRIALGKKKLRQHKSLIEEIANEYGVNQCVIMALWGMESSYGHYKGDFPVIKSLATLAFDGRRSQFFRKELLHALHIVQGGHVKLADYKGEWAGGSGHPQFLPSSWHQYAVDHNKDGAKDIWNNLDDVFASIANYLKQNGWETGQPWAVEVNAPLNLPRGFDETKQPLWKWQQLGVKPQHANKSISPSLDAWLIEPHGGPAMLAFTNFKVIKRYNNSDFYAGAIGHLAEEICRS